MRHTLLIPLCMVIFTALALNSSASDGDSLTQRRQLLSPSYPDATNVLDGMINKNFAIALKKVNRKRNPNRLDLEEAILSRLGDIKIGCISIPVAPLEKPIEKGLTKDYRINGKRVCIPSLTIQRSKSIYRDVNFCESPGVVLGMAAHFKIGDLVIGSDKISHFFAQGYEYIEVYRKRGTRAAVLHGDKTEKGSYGLAGNGIYSYGDLSANYSGLVFWINLTHPTAGHFTKCNGNWVQTKRFSLRCYANPAWDEGINPPCGPAFNTTLPYVAALVRCGKLAHCPPLHHETIPRIADCYPDWVLPHILNPKTLALTHPTVVADSSPLGAAPLHTAPLHTAPLHTAPLHTTPLCTTTTAANTDDQHTLTALSPSDPDSSTAPQVDLIDLSVQR